VTTTATTKATRATRSAAIALGSALAVALAGCAGGDGAAPAGPAGSITFGGGAGGAIYGVLATGMAEMANKNIPGTQARAEATAGGLQNTRLVRDGEVTFGFTDPRVVYPAVQAKGEFDGEPPATNLRFVMNGYPAVYQVTAQDPAIATLGDLRGKRVCTAAGIQTAMLGELLTPYGLTTKDMQLSNVDWTECADGLRSGNVDVIAYAGGAPAAVLIQAFAGSQAHIIGVDAAQATAITGQFPWWQTASLPAGTYQGQTSEIPTIQIDGGTLITRDDVSEETVYQLLTALDAHIAEFTKIHPLATSYALPGTAKNTMADVLPPHPGAVRFYKEKGIAGY
jgi:TRAP transporter TAXI family solute receptor